MSLSFVEVAVPLPVDRTFTYCVPAGCEAEAVPGRRVLVPFGRKGELRGFVVGNPSTSEVPDLKEVTRFLDEGPVLGHDVLALGRFLSRYYGCSLGEALDAMLPSGVKHGRASRTVPFAGLAVSPDEALARAEALPESRSRQARILRMLAGIEGDVPLADVLRKTGASRSPADSLVKAGLLFVRRKALPLDPLNTPADVRRPPPEPTGEQAKAIREISAAIRDEKFGVFLLFGITGSGKTEVYLRSIEAAIAGGRQTIVLVPEIALTPQTVRRFRARFDRVAVLHSAQSEAERRRWWREVQAGRIDVVVGPRSAVFAPVPRLGLLVVDEEHDSSFKQGRVPRYHARDIGIIRAREAGAAVILGSATPALESYHNARTGKYRMLRLTARVGGGELPPVETVDMGVEMKETKTFTHFSRRLKSLISGSLKRGEQVMLFLNRRGFSTLLYCRRCGESLTCESCSVTLTFHRGHQRAICHICGYERRVPPRCPTCGDPGMLQKGYGTERVEAEIRELHPTCRVARMDSDTMTTREAYEEVLDRVRGGEVDILVGTQMIAKGLHFPSVTAVGVIDADTSLRLPDFRSSERTFQLIAQVAGRTGRSERGGRVVVQTFRVGQAALTSAARHDYLGFAEEELRQRKAFGYPPYGRVLLVLVQGKKVPAVIERAKEVRLELDQVLAGTGARVLGPAVPLIEKIKDRYRRQIVVKAKDHHAVARAVAHLRGRRATKGGVDIILDVDPVGMA